MTSSLGGLQHAEEAGAVAHRGARDTLILETVRHRHAVLFGVLRAHAHLIDDARLRLLVGAESAVDGCSH